MDPVPSGAGIFLEWTLMANFQPMDSRDLLRCPYNRMDSRSDKSATKVATTNHVIFIGN
jgi:hypothetical protein